MNNHTAVTKKVHHRVNGMYPCRVDRRWGSSQITSVKCLDYVTCKNCLRIAGAKKSIKETRP